MSEYELELSECTSLFSNTVKIDSAGISPATRERVQKSRSLKRRLKAAPPVVNFDIKCDSPAKESHAGEEEISFYSSTNNLSALSPLHYSSTLSCHDSEGIECLSFDASPPQVRSHRSSNSNGNVLSHEVSPATTRLSRVYRKNDSAIDSLFSSPDHETMMTFMEEVGDESVHKSCVDDLICKNIKAASPEIRRASTVTARKRLVLDAPSTPKSSIALTPERSVLGTLSENVPLIRTTTGAYKRAESNTSAMFKDAKRLKCENEIAVPIEPVAISPSQFVVKRPMLRRLMSMNEAALAKNKTEVSAPPVRPALRKLMSVDTLFDQADLTGDFNHKLCLPLMTKGTKHPDLKTISADTMRRLLLGEFDDVVASYKIIDCRYPYEFEGGHIRGAINLYTEEQIREEILNSETEATHMNADGKRNIYIFHCEFSSERGPRQNRSLRALDRDLNKDNYPALKYPEIYLLHGGYKEFFENHSELCDPQDYRLMLDKDYRDQLEHYRSITKRSGDGLGTVSHRDAKKRMKSRTRLY